MNKLFTVPKTPIEQVWFTDTDDAVGLIAQRVQAGEPLGIDKEWTARFLLPLMERLPGTPACSPATAWTACGPARTRRSRS